MQYNKNLTAWNKIVDYFLSFDYLYGLRLIVGIGAVWLIAFRLDTDNPYWAIMTVIIVTLPTQSLLIEKFLARFVGTLIGAIMVNIIAAYALSDQWLFIIYMAFWLSLCSYLASAKHPIFTYCFALSGYTSAILGFVLSIQPTAYAVFQISQARVLEIMIGLATAFFISMLWPAYLERLKVKKKLRASRKDVRNLYISLLTEDSTDTTNFIRKYERILLDLMALRNLVFRDFFSISTEKTKNMKVYHYVFLSTKVISNMLSLNALKQELLITMPGPTRLYLANVKRWFLVSGNSANKMMDKPIAPQSLIDCARGRIFVQQMELKFTDIFNMRLYKNFPERTYVPSAKIYYSDRKEAILNAARTFLSIILGMAIWMSTQWEMGYVLLALIGITCTLGATFPMLPKLILMTLVITVVITIPTAFLLKFGLLIDTTNIVTAMFWILPIYFIAAIFRFHSMLGYLVGYSFLLASVYLIGFSNPMQYDFLQFVNQSFALVVALSILLVIFNIIPPSSNEKKIARAKNNIIHKCSTIMNNVTQNKLIDYEAYLNNIIYQTKSMPQSRERSTFFAYAFLTMVILRAQLETDNNNKWIIPNPLWVKIKAGDFQEALTMSELLAKQEDDIHYWMLQCVLKNIIEFLTLEQ